MSVRFADHLNRYGPDALARAPRPPDLAEAQVYCAHLARSHYENFQVIGWFTPKEARTGMEAIYAFCRWADDLGDEVGDPARSERLLVWWRDQLRAVFADPTSARHPVFVALAPTITRFNLELEPFENLISAFIQDQHVYEYQNDAQLLDYCRRSANPVGRLVLKLAEADDPARREWSDAICTGLQLANFWQDVACDLDIGRIYLPRSDRWELGYSDEDLHARRYTPAYRALSSRKVAQARAYLERGEPLAASLGPPWNRAVELFRLGGLAILRAIEACNHDVWTMRPVVGRWTKLALMAQVALKPPRRRQGQDQRVAIPPTLDSTLLKQVPRP